MVRVKGATGVPCSIAAAGRRQNPIDRSGKYLYYPGFSWSSLPAGKSDRPTFRFRKKVPVFHAALKPDHRLNFLPGPVSKTIHNRIVDDQELILRLQRGDEWAFQLLVRRFRKKIYAIAYGITLDAAESQDLVQEVFLQVYRSIGMFRGDASLGTLLRRIAVTRCLNWKRRLARRFGWRHVSTDESDDPAGLEPVSDLPSPENQVADAQARRQIDDALGRIPEQARTVFVLREVEGLSYEEIADAVGIKLGTVRSRLFHARRQLKEIRMPLKKEEG